MLCFDFRVVRLPLQRRKIGIEQIEFYNCAVQKSSNIPSIIMHNFCEAHLLYALPNFKLMSFTKLSIIILGMLLDFWKAGKYSRLQLVFFPALQKSCNIPCAWITLSCTENHSVIF